MPGQLVLANLNRLTILGYYGKLILKINSIKGLAHITICKQSISPNILLYWLKQKPSANKAVFIRTY